MEHRSLHTCYLLAILFLFLNVKESEDRALLYTLLKYEKIVGKAMTSKNQKFILAKILALR